jgi:perosamine synthetase
MTIPLIKPYITQEVKDKVLEVLDSGYLTEGPVTAEFEAVCGNYVGSKHAIAVTSCTTGLEMALRALDIGKGDEVIVPDYTYPATADVVAIVGATVVIVDVSKDTMLIDYDAIERAITSRTKAVIPVSLFGNPLDYDRLARIKSQFNVYIVEDAACALGAEYKGRKVGTFPDISVFSLHPRKFITTGEGGLVTTDDDTLAEWMKSYKHFGIGAAHTRESTSFERIGTNYKLSNILAAIGLVQMRHVEELLAERRILATRYLQGLTGIPDIRIPTVTPGGIHSYQSFCVLIPNRDRIMQQMRDSGIEVQIGTYALHLQPAFKKHCIHTNYDSSHSVFTQCLALPLFGELTKDDQQIVINELRKHLSQGA